MADSSSAYGSRQALQGSVTDLISGVEAQNNRDRQFKQSEDKIARDKLEKQQTKRSKNLEAINRQSTWDTGSANKNEFQVKTLRMASDLQTGLMEVLNNPANYSDKEVAAAFSNRDKLNNIAETMQMAESKFTEENVEYEKQVDGKKMWRNDRYDKNMVSGYGNKVPVFDENLDLVIAFIDEDNDGLDDSTGKKGKIGDYINYAEYLSGTSQKYDFMARYDRREEVSTDAAKFQSSYGDDALIKKRIESELYNVDNTPTDKLKSLARELNVKDYSTDTVALREIADGYVSQVTNAIAPSDKILDRNQKQSQFDAKIANDRIEKQKDRDATAAERKAKRQDDKDEAKAKLIEDTRVKVTKKGIQYTEQGKAKADAEIARRINASDDKAKHSAPFPEGFFGAGDIVETSTTTNELPKGTKTITGF